MPDTPVEAAAEGLPEDIARKTRGRLGTGLFAGWLHHPLRSSNDPDPQGQAQAREDLTIMNAILDRRMLMSSAVTAVVLPSPTAGTAIMAAPLLTTALASESHSAAIIVCAPKAKLTEKRWKYPHPADDLSFMSPRPKPGTGIEYWLIETSGDYSADCDKGQELGGEYLAYLGKHPTVGNGTLLTCIVRDMIDQAKAGQPWTGVHVGFLAAVNRAAMLLAHVQHDVGDRISMEGDAV